MTNDLSITIDGLEDVLARLARAEGAIQGPTLRKAVYAGAAVAEGEVKKLIQTGAKSGRIYPRGKKRFHQASGPGQAPATDTGFLVNSIKSESRSDSEAAVVVGAEYGAALEYGTSKMAARPFLRPVVDGKRDEIVKAVRDTIIAEIER